jgi:flagellar motor switch/type III secretory pathway protein FliN
MSLRPFLLLGESDRSFIRERVAAALAAWRGDWLAEEAPEPLLSPRAEPRARRWLVAGNTTAGQVALGCRDGWLQRLGALAAAGPEPAPERSPALAAKLGAAMLEALALELFGALSAAAAPPLLWDGECEAPDWLEPGAGGVIHDLWPLLPMIVVLSPQLVADALPKAHTRAGREPLAQRLRALQSAPVGLDAVVGCADLELGELARLAAGDVIVLDRRLDEPLALQLGAQPVARIHLGTAAGGKAVQVV